MAGKFVDLKEAATILGVTAEDLVDMRTRGEIFGYRDGASWKFKIEEVERVASERSASGKSGSGVLGDDEEAFDDFLTGDSGAGKSATEGRDDGGDSVLVTDEPIDSSIGKQSTVIGKELRGKKGEDSDLKLATGEETLGGDRPAASLSGKGTGGSEEAYDLASESSLGLADSGKGSKPPSGKGSDVLGDIQLAQPGSGTGVLGSGGGEDSVELAIGSGSYELTEAADDEDSISLDAGEPKKGHGSDVTYTPEDSGINLRSPTDSGLSLDEEPLDLGSGAEHLELPEEDDVIALEEEVADPDLATQLKADEAFSLSPAALEGGEADESDSGSQVIALEDSSAFDQNAATMLNQGAGGAALMPEGAFEAVAMPGFEMAPGMVSGTVAGAQPYVVERVETPYSVWNVLGLMSAAGVLAIAGMLMWTLMMNLWSFNEGTTVSTSLMDSIVSAIGLNPR